MTLTHHSSRWVDWFNNRRLLEPIGNIPPVEAEERAAQRLDRRSNCCNVVAVLGEQQTVALFRVSMARIAPIGWETLPWPWAIYKWCAQER